MRSASRSASRRLMPMATIRESFPRRRHTIQARPWVWFLELVEPSWTSTPGLCVAGSWQGFVAQRNCHQVTTGALVRAAVRMAKSSLAT